MTRDGSSSRKGGETYSAALNVVFDPTVTNRQTADWLQTGSSTPGRILKRAETATRA